MNPLIDKLQIINGGQQLFSKTHAGNNGLPDWVTTRVDGYTKLGTPYFDSVRFTLDENNFTNKYISCLISVVNSTNIVKSFVNGRNGGSIKQLVGEGDYDIVFNIKIISDFSINNGDINGTEVTKVGNGDGDTTVNKIFQGKNNFSNFDTKSNMNPGFSKYQGDYLPNEEIRYLTNFFSKFNKDYNYKNIGVESFYLNDCFGINSIVPYNITTSQNNESSNTYNYIISAYSDTDFDGIV